MSCTVVEDAYALLFCNRLRDTGSLVTLDRWQAFLSSPSSKLGGACHCLLSTYSCKPANQSKISYVLCVCAFFVLCVCAQTYHAPPTQSLK